MKNKSKCPRSEGLSRSNRACNGENYHRPPLSFKYAKPPSYTYALPFVKTDDETFATAPNAIITHKNRIRLLYINIIITIIRDNVIKSNQRVNCSQIHKPYLVIINTNFFFFFKQFTIRIITNRFVLIFLFVAIFSNDF